MQCRIAKVGTLKGTAAYGLYSAALRFFRKVISNPANSDIHEKLSRPFARNCIKVTRIRVQSRRSGDSLAQLLEVYLQTPVGRLQRHAIFRRRTLPNE